jgi:hypothetical protein
VTEPTCRSSARAAGCDVGPGRDLRSRRWPRYKALPARTGYVLEATICDSKLEASDRHLMWMGRARGIRGLLLPHREGGGSWCWSWRHSPVPHLARALSSALLLGLPRSPVPMPVERLVGSGWKRGHQDPGRRRGRNSPGRLTGRRPSPALLPKERRVAQQDAPQVFAPARFGARILEIRKCRRWWL